MTNTERIRATVNGELDRRTGVGGRMIKVGIRESRCTSCDYHFIATAETLRGYSWKFVRMLIEGSRCDCGGQLLWVTELAR